MSRGELGCVLFMHTFVLRSINLFENIFLRYASSCVYVRCGNIPYCVCMFFSVSMCLSFSHFFDYLFMYIAPSRDCNTLSLVRGLNNVDGAPGISA